MNMKVNNNNNPFQLTDPEVLTKLSKIILRARSPVEGSFSGIHRSHNKGSSVEFAQYRKYSQGDDISRLDWKVFARTDRLYVKEFESDTNMRCHIILDSSSSMNFENNQNIKKIIVAKKIAATLAQIAIKQGDAVGIQCFNEKISHDIPAKNNPAHLKVIFDIIKELSPKGKTNIIDVLHSLAEKIRRRALIILISDLYTEDLDSLLDCFQHMRHRKHDLAVFHLIDPQEMSLDFNRPIRFKDFETNLSIQTDPLYIRNEYQNQFEAFLKKIKYGCLEYKVDYWLINPSLPYDKALEKFLLSRSKRKG